MGVKSSCTFRPFNLISPDMSSDHNTGAPCSFVPLRQEHISWGLKLTAGVPHGPVFGPFSFPFTLTLLVTLYWFSYHCCADDSPSPLLPVGSCGFPDLSRITRWDSPLLKCRRHIKTFLSFGPEVLEQTFPDP